MLSDQLINELGLLKLQSIANIEADSQPQNQSLPVESHNVKPKETAHAEATTEVMTKPNPPTSHHNQASEDVKLDKNEFRLLVKMLQAINHDCIYENMEYDGTTVQYKHPKKILVFKDVTLADDAQQMNLSSLTDLLADQSMKRPTWEKLKTLKS